VIVSIIILATTGLVTLDDLGLAVRLEEGRMMIMLEVTNLEGHATLDIVLFYTNGL
jgi:hypothetical protein